MDTHSNYFDLFHLPVQIPVDIQKLSTEYQQLQRMYHPDNFATAPEAEKMMMLQKSATINDAFQTLKDPILSASYLLTLKGIDVSAEHNIINDTDFLMEQFILREQLDSIEQQLNQSQKEQELEAFSLEIKQKYQDTYQDLLDCLQQSEWQNGLNVVNKLRYLTRLRQQIDQLEDSLFAL